MANYTISITPEDDNGAHTTVRVDVEDGVPRITEVVMRPPSSGSPLDEQWPTVDFGLLLRALQPAVSVGREDPPAAEKRGAPAREEASGSGRKTRRRARTASGSQQSSTRTPRARAYRKTPADLAEVFGRLRSVTALGQHYGVPRHTAQGWVNRMRRQDQST
jgi:hypothetical protein